MRVACPYCNHFSKFKEVGPGTYVSRCSNCARKFKLTLPKDPALPPFIEPYAEAAPESASPTKANPGAAVNEDVDETCAHPEELAETEEYLPTRAARGAGHPAIDKSNDPVTGARDPGHKTKKPSNLPSTLDGYQILKKLGQGGMGTVLLARQFSLNRLVALKVINERCVGDLRFLARFTREAYAAAQLVHHNIVQIYDIGEDKGIHFFSMEYVKGQNLHALVKGHGKLDADVAAGYVVQAARGLKFAHDLGMIHRDVKPENLLLNDQGIIKVADLGLVKLPRTADKETPAPERGDQAAPPAAYASLSRTGAVVGTPAYMAPEQGRGQAIDGRADIYSLGCTLYFLLTGRRPFAAETAKQMLSQHANTPILLPPHVPDSLSKLLVRMMAKKPEDRFRDMGEVIEGLEAYLGVQSGPFTPREEQANVVASAVQRFNDAPMARVRTLVIAAFAALCPLFVLVFLRAGESWLAGAVAGLALLTPPCAFVVHGVFRGSPIFVKLRELAFASSWRDWLLWFSATVLVLLVLYLSDSLWIALGTWVVAVLVASGFYFGIETAMFRERERALTDAVKVFRDLRLCGVDEERLRDLTVKYSGRHWEEFFESLFGYEAMLAARQTLREKSGHAQARFGAWRDPLVRRLEARVQARRAARERGYLQAVEERYLRAQGVEPDEARRRAARMAEAFVGEAEDLNRSGTAADRAARMRRLLRAAQKGDDEYADRPPPPMVNVLSRTADLLFGARIRFAAGCLLLIACLLWVRQNELIDREDMAEPTAALFKGEGIDLERLEKEAKGVQAKKAKPLVIIGLPQELTGVVDSFNSGIAGMVMIVTCVFWGWSAGLAIWLGVLVALLGARFGISRAGPLNEGLTSLVAGMAIAVVGGFLLRRD